MAIWNAVPPPYELAVGQALLVLTPTSIYTVREGDTYESISNRTGLPLRTLYAYNPNLYGGTAPLYSGQTLVLSFAELLGEGQDTAANIVLLSTLLSMLTIPLMLLIV